MDTVALRIQAAFDGARAIADASDAMKALAVQATRAESEVAALGRAPKDLREFETVGAKVDATAVKLAEAEERLAAAQKAIVGVVAPSRQMQDELAAAAAAVDKLGRQLDRQHASLGAVSTRLKASGVDTRDLGRAQQDLVTRTDAARAALERESTALQRAAQSRAEVARIQANLNRALQNAGSVSMVASGAASLAAAMDRTGFSLQATVAKAISFESAMADVKKTVDTTPAGFAELTGTIRGLGREIPIAADGLAQIAAAGGQLGVVAGDIADFTTLTAKMATAFDMLPNAAGEAIAKLSNVFELPILKLGTLGDAINVLGNTTAAKEREIVDVLTRIGGTARQFGLSAEQASALSAAMLSLGKTAEVSATGINALLSKLQTAEVGSKSFQEGLTTLGISATDLAAQIQAKPQEALTAFLGKLKALDQQTRAIVLTQLFGQEYQDDISALVGSLGQYEQALAKVGDQQRTAGSLEKEFQNRSETTAAKLQLLKNAVDDIAIGFGTTFLPPLQTAATALSAFTQTFPAVSSAIAGTVAALGTLGLAVGVVGRGWAALATVAATVRAAWATWGVTSAAAAAQTAALGTAATGAAGGITAAGTAAAAVGPRLALLTGGLNLVAGAAVLLTSYKVGEAIGNWAVGMTATEQAAARLAETQGRLAAKLKEVSDATGQSFGSMQQFNQAVADGSIRMGEWSGQWAKVPPEVVKLEQELANLKAGLQDVQLTGTQVPAWLAQQFAQAAGQIGPAFKAGAAEVKGAMDLLKVDAGVAATGVSTAFQPMLDAYQLLITRSDLTARGVAVASQSLADHAKTTHEAQAAVDLLRDAWTTGRISVDEARPALDKLAGIIAKTGDATKQAAVDAREYVVNLNEVEQSLARATKQSEVWAASASFDAAYRAGTISAEEYEAAQDRVLAQFAQIRAAAAGVTAETAAAADQAERGANAWEAVAENVDRATLAQDNFSAAGASAWSRFTSAETFAETFRDSTDPRGREAALTSYLMNFSRTGAGAVADTSFVESRKRDVLAIWEREDPSRMSQMSVSAQVAAPAAATPTQTVRFEIPGGRAVEGQFAPGSASELLKGLERVASVSRAV